MKPASPDVAVPRRVSATLCLVLAACAATSVVARPAIDSSVAWGLLALLPAARAAGFDLVAGRVPDRLVALSVLVAATAVVLGVVGGATGSGVIGVVAGALAIAGPLLALHLVSPATIGFGDVKLAAALGAAVGLVDFRQSLWALAVASGSTLLIALVRRARSVAFAPGLVLGAALAIAGPPLATEIAG
jgi:leader peptidase (prepilin peptidase)/N-methyltransferase